MNFHKLPTTAVLLVVYGSIFTAVFLTNQLPPVPTTTHGLHFDQAFSDLQTITANPHPYNSHANDIVREYIFSRLTNITSPHPHAHLSSDLHSTASFFTFGRAVYFEGTSILVKIDGSDPDYQHSGGVLFSAHYDSVSTAPGASDNGIGVAAMMALVQYFLEVERPQRTVVFNFNNGEEDRLNGAHAYLEHPWSNITNTFLNVDAAASGGRPIIFRSTSIAPLAAFTRSHVPHPHANVLSSDAYARGLIRSSTDYQVYAQFQPAPAMHSMQGVDLALYKHRAFYHTKHDSIPGAEVDANNGAAKALWAMMEVVRGGGVELAWVGDVKDELGGGVPAATAAVYFDLFASTMILFPLSALLTSNIVLLIIGPVIVMLAQVGVWGVQRARARDRARASGNGNIVTAGWHGIPGHFWPGVSRWLRSGLSYWFRFWVMLAVVVGLQVGLVVGYLRVGYGYVVHSSPYLVLTSTLALAYLSTILVLSPPSPSRLFSHTTIIPHAFPPADTQKNSTLLQTYILTWLFLIASTIVVGQLGVGGTYAVTAWNAGVLGGVVVGAVEVLVWGLWTTDVTGRAGAEGQGLGQGEEQEGGEREGEGEEVTEQTPLLHPQQTLPEASHVGHDTKEDGAFGWWFVQMLLIVPVPVILVSHIGLMLLGALTQTLVDGSSATIVYAAISLLSVLIVLPLAPFAHKMHGSVTLIVFAIFIFSTAYTWTVFPFTMDTPFRVYFQQNVHLTPTSTVVPGLSWVPSPNASHSNYATYAPSSAHTSLTGLSAFLESKIIVQLPSARGKDVHCTAAEGRPAGSGMATCTWEVDVTGEMGPDPGTGLASRTWEGAKKGQAWLALNTTRLGANTARIAVRGVNARACSVSFVNRVRWWKVLNEVGGDVERRDVGHGEKMQSGYEIPEEGLSRLLLYSRTWDREFVVDVGWDQGGNLNGRVACQWAEYESGRVGMVGGHGGGKIPALEEVLKYLPLWAVVSKAGTGLVEGWTEFSL